MNTRQRRAGLALVAIATLAFAAAVATLTRAANAQTQQRRTATTHRMVQIHDIWGEEHQFPSTAIFHTAVGQGHDGRRYTIVFVNGYRHAPWIYANLPPEQFNAKWAGWTQLPMDNLLEASRPN